MNNEEDSLGEMAQRWLDLDNALRAGDSLAAQEPIAGDSVDLLRRLARHWPQPIAATKLPQIGPYVVEREIGRGGFGIVFCARHMVTQQVVALKVPRPELLLSESALRRFMLEAKAIAALQHDNIIPIQEAADVGPLCYIASDYCPGPSLAEALATKRCQLSPVQAAQVIEKLSGAVHYMHSQGFLHRDLKPSNVLLWPVEASTPDDLDFTPMLTDFGLAKFVDQSMEETRTSVLLGTPLYMAPEQAECRQDMIGPGTDIYALGAMLYELLCGNPPFIGHGLLAVLSRVRSEAPLPPRKMNPLLSQDLERICLKCLEKEPADRYATAELLQQDLQRFLANKPVLARPQTWWRKFSLWCRQPGRMTEAGILAIVANIVLMIWLWGNPASAMFMKRDDLSPLIAQGVAVTLFFHLPHIVAGWYTIQQKRWAIWLGLGLSLVQFSAAFTALIGLWAPVTDMYPNYLSVMNAFWLLTLIFSIEILCFAGALVASYQPRR